METIKIVLREESDKIKLDNLLKNGYKKHSQRFLPPDFWDLEITLIKEN